MVTDYLNNSFLSFKGRTPQYTPQANLFNTAKDNSLTAPTLPNQVSYKQYFDPIKLQQDIYKGIETTVNQQKDKAWGNIQNTMANAGLFRSGLTLANQQELERNTADSLAKGWGESALQVAQLQQDAAKTQAAMDLDINKYTADIQNAFKQKNFEYLMNAAAQDQNAINQAMQYNIQIKNAYDELAFKWAASLLDQEIREYTANLDFLAKEGNTIAQYGSQAAKDNWAKLTPTLYNNIMNTQSLFAQT